jgi:hypothetical protein
MTRVPSHMTRVPSHKFCQFSKFTPYYLFLFLSLILRKENLQKKARHICNMLKHRIYVAFSNILCNTEFADRSRFFFEIVFAIAH